MAEVRTEPSEIIISKIQSLLIDLQEENIGVEAAYLYGSHAAGTARPESDIDVAIVSRDLSGNRLEDWMRLNRIASQVDVRIEVIGFRPEQFRDENPLAWEVKTHGLKLL